jgi:histidinol-phosphate/aromatic aminotransferase/cobyric acid decarboxylase-like protein
MIDSIRAEEYHAYAPPAGMEELRSLIKADLGLPDASVLVTDGGVEGLYNACRNLCEPGVDFVTTDPGWKWPMAFAKASGARVIEIPIYNPEHGYRLTVAQLEAAVTDKTRMIYLGRSRTIRSAFATRPTRSRRSRRSRARPARISCTTARTSASPTAIRGAATYYPERTITIYSFSKWLGLAGMRIGAIVANADLIDRLAAAPPNNLGCNVDLAARGDRRPQDQAGVVPGDQPPAAAQPGRDRQGRWRACLGMRVAVYPSQANFLVVECIDAGITPEALVRRSARKTS